MAARGGKNKCHRMPPAIYCWVGRTLKTQQCDPRGQIPGFPFLHLEIPATVVDPIPQDLMPAGVGCAYALGTGKAAGHIDDMQFRPFMAELCNRAVIKKCFDITSG